MVRAPLAKGDDGSANRYPDRTPVWDGYPVSVAHERHVLSGVAHADCTECVPAALIVATPERFDPPCGADS